MKNYNEMTINEKLENALCTNHTGKMKNMFSISTSVLENPLCIARRASAEKAKENGSKKEIICTKCFAVSQFKMQTSTAKKYARNTELLTSAVYPVEAFPIVNACIFRIEAFGDVQNKTQALNYLHLIKRNPETMFTAWTKNPHIWDMAIKEEGKPENLIMIYSDPVVNGTTQTPEAFLSALRIGFPWIDKMFIVYRKTYANKNNVEINCGARSCNNCRRCYRKNTESIVTEILK